MREGPEKNEAQMRAIRQEGRKAGYEKMSQTKTKAGIQQQLTLTSGA